MESTEMETKNKKRKVSSIIPVLIAAGVAVSGIVGMNAFFTDKKSIDARVTVGTMEMEVTNLSDLDGNYNWKTDGSESSNLAQEGLQKSGFTMPEVINGADDGIINPGDDGIYAYTIKNTAQKSFDTATVTKVTISLPEAGTGGNVDIGNSDYGGGDKTGIEYGGEAGGAKLSLNGIAYTIPGLGTPGLKSLSTDGKTATFYYVSTSTKPLSGTKESDGDSTSVTYAYTTKFARNAGNEYQGATVKIETTIYAKQHRNSPNSTVTIDKDGKIVTTGDWSELIKFETTPSDSEPEPS